MTSRPPSPAILPASHGITTAPVPLAVPVPGGNSTPTPSLKKPPHRHPNAGALPGDTTDTNLDDDDDDDIASERQGSGRGSGSGRGPWWRIHLFRGMINDVRRRAPYYASDWTDAWNYRVVPATVYMYFAK